MSKFKLSVAGLATLLMCGSLYAADPAGKILVLQGSATVVRSNQETPLSRGSQVENGDLIKVGEASNLQIRFIDESIVALRAGSQFSIKDFRFNTSDNQDRSVFSLLKGGLRTITGLIGKRNPEAYKLDATTATIGIRGTHFTVVKCASDCTNEDGSTAEDGLYGSVTSGRIVVSNQAGDSEFSRDQYFRVADINSLPKELLSPPAFLREKLVSLNLRQKGNTQSASTAQQVTVAETATPAMQTTPLSVLSLALNTTQEQNPYVPADTPETQTVITDNIVTGGSGSSGGSSSGGVIGSTGTGWGTALAVTGTDSTGYGRSSSSAGTVYMAGVAYFSNVVNFMQAAVTGTDSDGSSYSKTAATDTGYSSTGNVYWGRYAYTNTYSTGPETDYQHEAFGNPVTALPTSGVFTYSPVGGTGPTDQYGNVGTMTNRGAWTLDFGGQTLATTQDISWTMPSGASYSLNVPQQSFVWTTGTTSGTSYAFLSTPSSNVTCTTCSYVYSYVELTPLGANAEALSAAVSTEATVGGNQENTASVQVYTAGSSGTGGTTTGGITYAFDFAYVDAGTGYMSSGSSDSYVEGGHYQFVSGAAAASNSYNYVAFAESQGISLTQVLQGAYTITTATETINKSASTDTGSTAAGNVFWGRYFEDGTDSGGSWTNYSHWAMGDPVTSLPTSGIFTYSPVGGTSPTDQNGNIGTMTNRGAWTVDFGGQTLATSQNIEWTMPNGSTYSVYVPQQGFIMSSSTANGITSTVMNYPGTSTSCTGSCSLASSSISLTPMGANAETLSAAISTLSGTTDRISSVQIYQR